MRILNRSGQSLVESLVALSMFSAVLVAVLKQVEQQRTLTRTIQTVSARNSLATALLRQAAMPAALRNSVDATTGTGSTPDAANDALRRCVTGGGCDTSSDHAFNLYGPNGSAWADDGVIAGSDPSTAVRYDYQGVACDAGGPCPPARYPFVATVSFRAYCAPPAPPQWNSAVYPDAIVPAASCDSADLIAVTLRIDPTPGAAGAPPSFELRTWIDVWSITHGEPYNMAAK